MGISLRRSSMDRPGAALVSAVALTLGGLVATAAPASAATCAIAFDGSASMDTVAELQTAIDAAATGACATSADTVVVTFTANLTTGGTQLEWRNGYLANLTLQGTATLDASNSGRVLNAFSAPSVVTINGLTITRGAAASHGGAVFSRGNLVVQNATFLDNNTGTSYGSAIGSDRGADLTVVNSTFTRNGTANDDGGAIYWEGDVTITDSTFTTNVAGEGGAVWHSTGSLTISGSTFSGNEARDTDGGAILSSTGGIVDISSSTFSNNTANDRAGAVYVRDSASISGSTFTSNSALDQGGAIFAVAGLTVSRSTFTTNSSSSHGGAISAWNPATFTVDSSQFSGNSARGNGGAIDTSSGRSATITASTFASNTATQNGGALFFFDAGSVTNSTITGNSAQDGGGVYLDSEGPFVMDFVTLVSNVASGVGANMRLADGDARVTVRGTVIGNAASGSDNCSSNLSRPWTVVDSVIDSAESASCGAGFTAASWSEIALGSLADNGGPTQTMMPAESSVLVGFVTNASATALTSEDQRGYARSGDYTAGAVEWSASAPEPDLSQVPPSWYQAYQRLTADEVCLPGWNPSWAEWPGEGLGGWTCERTIWWDVRTSGWDEQPGFRSIRLTG